MDQPASRTDGLPVGDDGRDGPASSTEGSDGECVRAPRQARSQETYDRFVDATIELLAEKPFDQITVSDIVRRADRTVGSFYARFEDKYAVLYAIVRDRDVLIRDRVRTFCEPSRWAGIPLEVFVTEAVRLNVLAYRRSSVVLRTAITACTIDERIRKLRRESLRFYAETQKEFFRARSADVKRADVERASDQMFEIMTMTLEHELLFGRFTTSSPESDSDLVADLSRRCLFALGLIPD